MDTFKGEIRLKKQQRTSFSPCLCPQKMVSLNVCVCVQRTTREEKMRHIVFAVKTAKKEKKPVWNPMMNSGQDHKLDCNCEKMKDKKSLFAHLSSILLSFSENSRVFIRSFFVIYHFDIL